ncbi:hypothetical protein C2W64_03566 [Brevibacillus laterosporus]|nr:hypothetical protein C2W64_03566 [Brevibacillus laterosporus]
MSHSFSCGPTFLMFVEDTTVVYIAFGETVKFLYKNIVIYH